MGLTALLMQVVYGALIVAFALSRSLPLSEVLLFLTGFALMLVFSTVTSLVQLIAPNEMRGSRYAYRRSTASVLTMYESAATSTTPCTTG